jgi:hypothetical protein
MPCGHAQPQAQDQLHGVCLFCWRDRAGALAREYPGWGVGDKADAKPFDRVVFPGGGRELELIHGQYPHSRSDNNTYARDERGSIDAWDGHRWPVAVRIAEGNYLKTSGLSGDEWRGSCIADVSVSGVHVYQLRGRDWLPVMSQLPPLISKILAHPVRFWDAGEREKQLVERKVWYQDQAAVVTRWNAENGVFLVPDGTWFFRTPGYEDNEDAWQEDYGRGLYCDVLSDSIFWWRD